MPTWLVSLPLQGRRRDACWEQLQEATTGLSTNSKLEVLHTDCFSYGLIDHGKLRWTQDVNISPPPFTLPPHSLLHFNRFQSYVWGLWTP